MLVTRSNFPSVLEALSVPGDYGFDTETTGLRPYHGDRLFSLIIASADDVYYFNFQPYPSFVKDGVAETDAWLGESEIKALQENVFNSPGHVWAMHNAKFDLRMSSQEWITFVGKVHCTMSLMRIIRNDLSSYSLDSCGQYAGLLVEKSSAVRDYCDEHGCFEHEVDELTGKKKKNYKYHMVPLEIMQPYAETDAVMTRQLMLWQRAKMLEADALKNRAVKPMQLVYDNEIALTKTVFEMEHVGILVDVDFCRGAVESQKPRAEAIISNLSEMCGRPFVDSGKFLGEVFKERGVVLPQTEKGNVSVSESVLVLIDDPVAKEILKLRGLNKSVKTYFQNFLSMADPRANRIHADLVPSGAATGRFSCRDPNLQNLTKSDEDGEESADEFNVRDAFIPTPGFCFFAPDYSQMEYRMMLDYAEEMAVIKQIIEGVDVHQATANMTGLSRRDAKTFNFAFLYGAGTEKLSQQLKKSLDETKKIKEGFNRNLPRVAQFVAQVKQRAEVTGYVTNWLGRRCYFAERKLSYSAPNHLIQGGCADVNKVAMVRIHDFLKPYKSRLLLCIHDENIIELHESELHLAQEICRIMETAFPHKYLPLLADPSYSWQSLGRKVKGYPQAK